MRTAASGRFRTFANGCFRPKADIQIQIEIEKGVQSQVIVNSVGGSSGFQSQSLIQIGEYLDPCQSPPIKMRSEYRIMVSSQIYLNGMRRTPSRYFRAFAIVAIVFTLSSCAPPRRISNGRHGVWCLPGSMYPAPEGSCAISPLTLIGI
jgi:hypothetical protein